MITERTVLTPATMTVLKKDCINCRFSNILPYHSRVKPSKVIFILEVLKENAITTKIGRYKNK